MWKFSYSPSWVKSSGNQLKCQHWEHIQTHGAKMEYVLLNYYYFCPLSLQLRPYIMQISEKLWIAGLGRGGFFTPSICSRTRPHSSVSMIHSLVASSGFLPRTTFPLHPPRSGPGGSQGRHPGPWSRVGDLSRPAPWGHRGPRFSVASVTTDAGRWMLRGVSCKLFLCETNGTLWGRTHCWWNSKN